MNEVTRSPDRPTRPVVREGKGVSVTATRATPELMKRVEQARRRWLAEDRQVGQAARRNSREP